MKAKSKVWVPVLVVALVVAVIVVAVVAVHNFNTTTDLEQIVHSRISAIRATKNSDVTGRTGKIYYLSNKGDDQNDGLSASTAWQSLAKINNAFQQKTIQAGDTILLNRGDEFRGNLSITACDILIGSYGDENKSKPQILVSPYDGATQGQWTQVEPHIWHYTVDGQDPFKNDIGVIWCFKNGKSYFTQKITNNFNTDETQINLREILTEDLQFYHCGHASTHGATGGALYLYSTTNPAQRFTEIEFNLGRNGIGFSTYTNLHVDNITLKHAGNHGIGGGTVANLKVTNCELGYIGGAMQYYKDETGNPVRFGNAIEIYGSVTATKGYAVEDGFVVNHNYIYQVYDAGITFQITAKDNRSPQIEKAIFSNNVVENCNYDIEYWNTSTSTDETVQNNTYINQYTVSNNLMRNSGYGVCTTRPDCGGSAIIKTWEHSTTYDNRVIGEFKICDNIFATPAEQMFYISASDKTFLPKVTGNQFYSSKDVPFGYCYASGAKIKYPFTEQKLKRYFPGNQFNYLEKDFANKILCGTSGDLNWELSIAEGVLVIDGTGAMADYTVENLPAWHQYQNSINKIIIGENVTKLGKYSFYKLPYVEELVINATALENFSRTGANDGDNYTFYQMGKDWIGIDLTFGPEVTRVPAQIFWPASYSDAPKITGLHFAGNQIEEIGDHAFLNLRTEKLVVPDGVKKIGTLAFSGASAKTIILPDTVDGLGAWVFAGCKNAEKIVLSANITKIGVNTFHNTNNLQQLVIPGNVTFNGSNYENLFSKTSTTTVYGNATVKKLVEDYCAATGTNHIKYADLSQYPNLIKEIRGN